jgi:hypothetical protein
MATVDQNWFNPNNWYDTNSVPDISIHALVPSNAPEGVSGPIINGDAACMYLNIEPWSQGRSYTEWGVDMNSGTLDCNYGIAIGAFQSFSIADGGIPTFTVHGGTVRQLLSPGDGVLVGGGGDGYGETFGKLYMYGGYLTTPRLELRNGEILLYGGTIECDGNDDPNFVFYQNLPSNKITVNGGTLKLKGDRVSELNSLIFAQWIVSSRGEFIGPTYTDGNTVLTSTFMPGCAWQPSPEKYATDVRYHTAHPASGSLNLRWKAGDWIGEPNINEPNNGHYVFLGTVYTDILNAGVGPAGTALAVYKNHIQDSVDDSNDPNLTITEASGPLKPNTTYYWRVDEVNEANYPADLNDPYIVKGMVWEFKTITDKATNPQPVTLGTGLKMPLQLSWTAGDWSPTLHRVYFTSVNGDLSERGTNDTTGMYRGTVSSAVYPLSKLREDRGGPVGPDWALALNTTYYWCIDEDSSTGGVTNGTVWQFNTGSSISIEDFQEYGNTTDLNNVWKEGIPVSPCNTRGPAGQVSLVSEGASDKYMQFTYDNMSGGTEEDPRLYYSQLDYQYNDANWTTGSVYSSPPRLLELFYRGQAVNSADPIYDRMYVAIEDTGGDVNIVLNPDPNAQKTGGTTWTNWAISYKVLGSGQPGQADLNHVSDLYIGMGLKCNNGSGGVGGTGNVMFDNIRVLSATCVASEGPLADFDNDCIVDLRDLDIMTNDWLHHGEDLVFSPYTEPNNPILWYKFEETGSTTLAQDSGTGDANNYVGTINNWTTHTWKSAGGRDSNGCLYLPSGGNSYVSIDVASLSFMGDANHSGPDGGGLTFATWIDADLTAFGGWIYGFIVVKDNNGADATDIACPHHHNYNDWSANNAWAGWTKSGTAGFSFGPSTTAANYGGRWNHWAFVKAPHTLSWYCNGSLLKQEADTDANNGDPNIYGPLFPLPVSAFTIGLGGWGGNWAGYIDDFQVYDYALSAAEVAYLASDGDGHLILPLTSPANINTDGSTSPETDPNQIINFGDLALMVNEWLTTKLWPQ